ncbi:hypothetical protein FACS1894180_9250 [Bacteroidia bacterium]|nr:hypothetical protein FACS1894180_9250 [Bacteroidia bacterium]
MLQKSVNQTSVPLKPLKKSSDARRGNAPKTPKKHSQSSVKDWKKLADKYIQVTEAFYKKYLTDKIDDRNLWQKSIDAFDKIKHLPKKERDLAKIYIDKNYGRK